MIEQIKKNIYLFKNNWDEYSIEQGQVYNIEQKFDSKMDVEE